MALINIKNKYEASYLECNSNKYAINMISNQSKALNKALETERNKYHTLVKSKEGLKERYKMCTDDKTRLTKEIAGIHKNKLDNHAMQYKLDFAKREYESVSSRSNAKPIYYKHYSIIFHCFNRAILFFCFVRRNYFFKSGSHIYSLLNYGG